jgi:hypothetical protein
MKVAKYFAVNKIEIWSPRYKDRTVLIAAYKVRDMNEIVFTKSKHLAGMSFFMRGFDIKKYPKTTNGKLVCYTVPLDDLEPLEREE